MLKCGECTFLKDSADGICSCGHPEKPKAESEMVRICDYEADCQHGYQDVWAARGAARLIAMQKPPEKKATISSSSVFNNATFMNMIGTVASLGLVASMLKKK